MFSRYYAKIISVKFQLSSIVLQAASFLMIQDKRQISALSIYTDYRLNTL